jgi:hypothetical protein
MRSIFFGILALLALFVVSALGARFFVPPNSAGPDPQVIPPAALAQSGDKSRRDCDEATG